MRDIMRYPAGMSHRSLKAFIAASEGRLEDLQKLTAALPELLQARDQHGYTLLHRASLNGHLDTVQWLLDKVQRRGQKSPLGQNLPG